MDEDGFRAYLGEREIPEDQIGQSISTVREFEDYIRDLEPPKALRSVASEDFAGFSALMIEKGNNSYDNYAAIARYGYFSGNNDLYLAVLELLDGADVVEILFEKLGQHVGAETRDQVFEGIELPPLGTPSSEKPTFTQAVMERMERIVDLKGCEEVLSDVAHGIPKEYHAEERERFLKARDIDEYIREKRSRAIAQLEKHNEEQTLFFNQEITDEVLEFVKGRPDMLTGERRGSTIFHTKIPYLTKEYLAETDKRMKCYYYCHCAWAREAIKTGDVNVSPTFCYCSAGFTKMPWEVALDQPLEVETVKSVLKGDLECSFVIHLPEDVISNVSKK
jgi:hypothetical protein